MDKIEFWQDRDNKKIDPTLFSVKAEDLAKELAQDCEQSRKKLNKRTQVRKFYDEVVRLQMETKNSGADWDSILPLINMITAKAAYAKGRDLVSNNFLNFMRSSIEQIKEPEDLEVFANLFEAFYGFYRLHCPAN